MEPPYGVISSLLKKRRVVPFLGAGASIVGRPPGAAWEANAPAFLPTCLDLSHLLADEVELLQDCGRSFVPRSRATSQGGPASSVIANLGDG